MWICEVLLYFTGVSISFSIAYWGWRDWLLMMRCKITEQHFVNRNMRQFVVAREILNPLIWLPGICVKDNTTTILIVYYISIILQNLHTILVCFYIVNFSLTFILYSWSIVPSIGKVKDCHELTLFFKQSKTRKSFLFATLFLVSIICPGRAGSGVWSECFNLVSSKCQILGPPGPDRGGSEGPHSPGPEKL